MVSFSTLKTLLFTLGPLLLPKLFSYYRSYRATSAAASSPVTPLPTPIRRSLNILFLSSLIYLVSTLPLFSPENIFTLTSSRLQTPTDVLFSRLATLRPSQTLLLPDQALKPRIASLDARCLYLTYGPATLRDCPFCTSDDPKSYLYYHLPHLLLPHLAHLFVLGLATSSAVAGKHGNRWRNSAAILGAAMAALDVYLFASRDYKANRGIFRPENLVHFFWLMRTLRGVAIAGADVFFALLLYLSSTNRLFGHTITNAERLETVLKTMEQTRGKLSALGIVKNVVVRDCEGLGRRGTDYWRREKVVMGEVMDEREVVEGVRDALEKRVRVESVEEEARRWADGIVVGTNGDGGASFAGPELH